MQRSRYLITWQALYFTSSAPRMLRVPYIEDPLDRAADAS